MMQSERMNNTCDQLEAGEESRIAWVRVVPVREADKHLADKKNPGEGLDSEKWWEVGSES